MSIRLFLLAACVSTFSAHSTPVFASVKKPVTIIAHRGFSGVAPENSLAAFQKAIDIGADMIEFDVMMSKDGEVIVMHDDTLDRTTTGKGPVKNFTLSQLKTLDIGSWFAPQFKDEKVPTLREVLEMAKGKIKVNIEIKMSSVDPFTKRNGIEEKIANLVRHYGMSKDTMISSFSPIAIQRVKEFAPEITGALLYHDILGFLQRFNFKTQFAPKKVASQQLSGSNLLSFKLGFRPNLTAKSPLNLLRPINADAINPDFKALKPDWIHQVHEARKTVNTYTVNKEKDMKRLINMGVDGIITDYPNRLIKYLTALSLK